ncbi:GNAT family N-acetyltransferase [Alkalicoccus luteus]|uniref:GNAT family N-acetyltransferase n=1 Tax=Alkalicoccus luteus TaxID=1237094 RepID=A0A969PSV2_9BACI|nr:GNAT family protein [Alkalicoccus luteus]NJP38459.1 GNAT family N-acetyltransferase [Alkalicoccus luteus]
MKSADTLTIRPFTAEDDATLISWITSPEMLVQWAGTTFSYPLTSLQLEEYRKEPDSIIWSAEKEGRLIGHLALRKIDHTHNSARIGKVIIGVPEERGRGYAGQMVTHALSTAFDDLQLHRVSLGVFDFNAAAIHAYQKLGFHYEGTYRDFRKVGDTYWNLIEMSMLEDEWRERNA